MVIAAVVKGNRLLTLLTTIFNAHVDIVSNLVVSRQYNIALTDTAIQSLGLGSYALALNSLVSNGDEFEFKEGLKVASRVLNKFKEACNINNCIPEFKEIIANVEALIAELTHMAILI